MQRTPEPELMEGEEQALAYAAADFSAGDQSPDRAFGGAVPARLG